MLHMLTMYSGGGLVMAFHHAAQVWPVCAGADGVLGRAGGGFELRHQLCADPVAAFHRGHQAACHDRPGHGRQTENLADDQAVQEFVMKWATWCARRWRRCWAMLLVLPAAMLLSWLLARWMGHLVLDEATPAARWHR